LKRPTLTPNIDVIFLLLLALICPGTVFGLNDSENGWTSFKEGEVYFLVPPQWSVSRYPEEGVIAKIKPHRSIGETIFSYLGKTALPAALENSPDLEKRYFNQIAAIMRNNYRKLGAKILQERQQTSKLSDHTRLEIYYDIKSPEGVTGFGHLVYLKINGIIYSFLGMSFSQTQPADRKIIDTIIKSVNIAGSTGKADIADLNKQVVQLVRTGQYHEAVTPAMQAVALQEKALGSQHPKVATALNNLARVRHELGEYDEAEALYLRALDIKQRAFGRDHPEVASIQNNLADFYRSTGNYNKAQPLFYEALNTREKHFGPDHSDVAATLNNMAVLFSTIGDYDKAETFYRRALVIKEKLQGKDHPGVAAIVVNIAELYRVVGRFNEAEQLFDRALEIREKRLGPDHPDVALTLNNMATLYVSYGDYARAKPLFERALLIMKSSLGDMHPHTAHVINGLGSVYFSMGNYGKAGPMLKEALKILETSLGPNHKTVAQSLNNLAMFYSSLGDYDRAEQNYKRALKIGEDILGQHHPDIAVTLNNLAEVYIMRRDYRMAEDMLLRSQKIFENAYGPNHEFTKGAFLHRADLYLIEGKIELAVPIMQKFKSLGGLGYCYLARREYGQAAKMFNASLAADKGNTDYKITHHIGLAMAYEGMAGLAEARLQFQLAINLIESQWQELELADRKSFLTATLGSGIFRVDAYEGIVRVIVKEKKKGFARDALQYAERVKSRTLHEMLAARNIKGVQKADMEILEKDRQFQIKSAKLRKRLSILNDPAVKASRAEKNRVETDLNILLQEYEKFINEVKLQNKELASLITIEVAPLEKIQSYLDPSVTILEYFIAKDKTYAWIITKGHMAVHELTISRNELETLVNELRLPNISDRSKPRGLQIVQPAGGFEVTETSRDNRARNRERFLAAATYLYRRLVKPLDQKLDSDHLIIVPHGVLHKVPFAALADGTRVLLNDHSLSVVPSATVIEYVVEKRNADQGRFLSFANPKTDQDPLAYSELEVNRIAGLFAKQEKYFHNDATEKQAKNRSPHFDIIHFATHGQFNDKQPMQSGLLLAKDADNDGYLQLHEIFSINLQNANLVTLSACETALSKIYSGDDLVGLSRGFIYAGAPSILATLWSVEDRSTALLIQRFYENWKIRGLSKPEALREAQLYLKSQPQFNHPFYWAPYVIIGDWL